jgi:hypothetical protein
MCRFDRQVRKKDPLKQCLNRFSLVRWGKVWGKNHLDLRAFDDQWVRCKSAVFRQSGRNNASVSTRTETGGYTGFSGIGPHFRGEKRSPYRAYFSLDGGGGGKKEVFRRVQGDGFFPSLVIRVQKSSKYSPLSEVNRNCYR